MKKTPHVQLKTKTKRKNALFYAVRAGRKPGVYRTWSDCEHQTTGFPGSRFKKFMTECEAIAFIENKPVVSHEPKPKPKPVTSCKNKPIITKQQHKDTPTDPRRLVIYTDGSCLSNGSEYARAGVGVWFGVGDAKNLSCKLEGRQTNQRAELTAAIRAVQISKNHAQTTNVETVEIWTDSTYVLNGTTKWMAAWKLKRWPCKIMNTDLWKLMDAELTSAPVLSYKWCKVKAHSGVFGNEMADKLANDGARMHE